MRMLPSLLCLIAVLAFVLTGLASSTRAAQAPVTEMIICGGSGPETVRLDAQGNPVKGECCDCLQCLLMCPALSGAPLRIALLRSHARADRTDLAAVALAPQRHGRPMPRGPPSLAIAEDSSFPRLFLAALEFGQVPRGKAVAGAGQPQGSAR